MVKVRFEIARIYVGSRKTPKVEFKVVYLDPYLYIYEWQERED